MTLKKSMTVVDYKVPGVSSSVGFETRVKISTHCKRIVSLKIIALLLIKFQLLGPLFTNFSMNHTLQNYAASCEDMIQKFAHGDVIEIKNIPEGATETWLCKATKAQSRIITL